MHRKTPKACGQNALISLKPLDETGSNLKDKIQILKITFKILHNSKVLAIPVSA